MSIVLHGETRAAFCFLPLLLMAAPSLRLRHRHLIVALHGHQLMQTVAFLIGQDFRLAQSAQAVLSSLFNLNTSQMSLIRS